MPKRERGRPAEVRGSGGVKRPTGPVVRASKVIAELRDALDRWSATATGETKKGDELTSFEVFALVRKTARTLERACWCDHGVCCDAHRNHVSPHQNCFLR